MLALQRLGSRLVGRREGALRDRRNVFLPKYSPGKNNGKSVGLQQKGPVQRTGPFAAPLGLSVAGGPPVLKDQVVDVAGTAGLVFHGEAPFRIGVFPSLCPAGEKVACPAGEKDWAALLTNTLRGYIVKIPPWGIVGGTRAAGMGACSPRRPRRRPVMGPPVWTPIRDHPGGL